MPSGSRTRTDARTASWRRLSLGWAPEPSLEADRVDLTAIVAGNAARRLEPEALVEREPTGVVRPSLETNARDARRFRASQLPLDQRATHAATPVCRLYAHQREVGRVVRVVHDAEADQPLVLVRDDHVGRPAVDRTRDP